MEKTDDRPLWVYLAFSSINTRRGALWLIWVCVVFTLYCIPWSLYFVSQDWVVKVFLIKGWSWFAVMLPMTLWYWICLMWMDRKSKWETKKIKPTDETAAL